MIYIVVLNYKGIKDTINCLRSIEKLDYHEYRVVVVDNNSQDDSVKEIESYIRSDFGHKVDLLRSNTNLGYAGGNNLGIKFALKHENCSYVWILNNDTIVTPTSLSKLVESFQNSDDKVGVFGSALVYEQERSKVQGIGGVFNAKLGISKHVGSELNYDSVTEKIQYPENYEVVVDYVIGASMLISRECIESVGLLSEDYFLYFEELDYCYRIKSCDMDFRVSEQSVVFHKEGGSTNGGKSIISDFYQIKNRLKITKKYNPKYYPLVYISLIIPLVNRLKRREYQKAWNVAKIIFTNGRLKFSA